MTSRILERRGIESEELFKALGSEIRLRMLELLSVREMNINEIRQELGAAHPSVSKHIRILEEAGLVTSEYMPGEQGTQKRCRLRYDRLVISLENTQAPSNQIEEIEMPVGMYTFAHPAITCGLASQEGIIGFYDEPQAFLLPQRSQAQILWMGDGFVEYVFPNTVPTTMEISRVELSMEICSESPDYNTDYPSDITLWINGVEVGVWTSPGDMGGKRGRLNPPWWSNHDTQHGMLKIWSVDAHQSYVDGAAVSSKNIKDIMLLPRQPVTVRIGIKPDAQHKGGFNLFGRGFGNYDQDITLRLHYQEKDPAAQQERRSLQTALRER